MSISYETVCATPEMAAPLMPTKADMRLEEAIFEHDANKAPRTVSPLLKSPADEEEAYVRPVVHEPKVPLTVQFWTYFTLIFYLLLSHMRDLYRKFVPKTGRKTPAGYAPIVKDFDDFWQRRFYRRMRDVFNHPIDSRPSRVIGVMERTTKDHNLNFEFTGRVNACVNMGSYNYLGFAEDTPSITHDVLDSFDTFGTASCSAPREAGQSKLLTQLEHRFAEYVGKEDAIVCGMGFGTNFRGLPALFGGKETLAISDSLNHCSLVHGVRCSGSKVKVFKHGRYDQLEELIRESIILGQNPEGEYKPWRRIVLIVEGIYSMEGEILDLQSVVELKKKYNLLLFVDEAHSIGAIGRTGRGVCEHCGVDPADVDILMGTFTKSFGAIGGYVAGNKKLIDFLRQHSSIALQCDTLAPPCVRQILSVLDVLLGNDGTDLGQKRIRQLKENARFLRQGLIDQGFIVLGDDASPVIPVMCYHLGKLGNLSRKCMERGVAIVVVGYPATPLLESRIRFCVSACHTREDLQIVLNVMTEINKEVFFAYNANSKDKHIVAKA